MSRSEPRPAAGATLSAATPAGVAIALLLRLIAFALAQVAIAVVLAVVGTPDPWSASMAWWPFSMIVGSAATFLFLRRLSGSAVLAVVLPALFLSLQHATAPLALDPGFVLWRGTEFLGFAVVLALGTLRWPRILPYLVIGHFLLDLQSAVLILVASAAA